MSKIHLFGKITNVHTYTIAMDESGESCRGVATPAIETVTTRNSVTAAADFDVWRPDAIRPVTRGIRDN